jgi:hypothetical protein
LVTIYSARRLRFGRSSIAPHTQRNFALIDFCLVQECGENVECFGKDLDQNMPILPHSGQFAMDCFASFNDQYLTKMNKNRNL